MYIQSLSFKMEKMLFLCEIWYIFQAVCGAPTSQRCQSTGQNPHGCCDGYLWDSVDDNCVECSPGYSGPGCIIACPYPLYGKNCQNICMCSTTEYCNFMSGCLKGEEATPTVQITDVSKFVKIVNFEGKSTSTIPKFTKSNIDVNLENRIQTIWQFVLIMLAVFSVLASTYLGKCVHRQWTSRAVQVSNNSTSTPDIALNMSNQTEYEQIQNVEYEDPERYLPASHDDSRGGSVNNSEEKIDSVYIRQSLELLSEEALVGEHKSENVLYENQSNSGVREADDLYLTPIT